MNRKNYSLFFVLILSLLTRSLYSATFYSRTSGNWNTASTWSIVSCSGAAAATVPGAADNVVICAGKTVTMNGNPGNCLSLTVNGTVTWTSAFTTNVGTGGLTLNTGALMSGTAIGILNVAGALTQTGGTSTIGGITLSVTGTTTLSGTLAFNNAGGTKTFTNIIVNSGGDFSSSVTETYAVSGNVTMNGGSLTGSSSGNMNVAGNLIITAGATAAMGNININVSGLTSISGALTDNSTGGSNVFNNVDLNATGSFNNTSAETYTINGNLNTYGGDFLATGATPVFLIAGNFNIVSGTCDVSRIKFTVSGTTTVSGTLNINSTRGTKTFNDLVVTSTGAFNSTVAENYTVNGNIQANGTFVANLGSWTLAGTGKTISGSTSLSFADVTDNGSYTNSTTVSISTSFKGSGTWTQASTGILNVGASNANFSVNTFNASAAGNTVNYSRSGNQSVFVPNDGSYSNLSLSGSGTKTLANNTVLSGNLLISSPVTFDASNNNLSVAGDFTNNSTFSPGGGFGVVSTVTLNGTTAQTLGGTSSTAFKNLTISNSSAIVTAAANFSASGTFTVGSGSVFSPNAAVIVSGTGTMTGNGEVRVTRTATTPDFISQYTIASRVLSGLNVNYIGAGNQNVNTLNYGSLTVSTNGTRTVTFPSAVVGVSNVFSPAVTSTSYVITGNTIDFNGTVAQTVPVFNYNNLTSSSTGARTLSPSGIIGVAGVFTPGTNAYTVTGSTVNYIGTAAQTITAFNYYNLASSSTGARTLPSTGTVGVASSFVPGTNAYTVTGSTVNFNGTIAESIPAFNYYNLTSSSTGSRALASSGTVGVAAAFTPGTNSYTVTGSTVNFNGTIAQGVPAFNYYNLASSSTGARTLASSGTIGVASSFVPGTNAYTVTGSTVNFNGTIAETVPAFNYYNLTSSSSGSRTLASSGTVGVAAAFTPGTNAYTVTGSTVNFNGTITQTVPAFNYYNLTSSSTGARTLASSGTVGVAAVFTPGTNAYTVTGSTVDYNGSSAQNINAFNYYNLTSSSTGARTLASSGITGVAGAFTPGTNAYTVTGSTVDFNGSIAQSVPAFTYNHLTASGSGIKSLSGNITVNGNLAISSSLDASVSNYSATLKGNWTNNGTFNARNGAVIFSGSAAQTLSGTGTTAFYRLDMNNSSGGVKLNSGSYTLSSVINPLSGNFNTNGQSFTMLSDASATARIGQLGSGASLSGNFTIQRFISSRSASFADLSSTVQLSSFLDWDNELPAISYSYSPPYDEPSAYTYNETTDAYVPVLSSSSSLTPGKGYEVFLSGDYSYATLPNTTTDVIGVPNQGTYNLSGLISNNVQGWNLVGNPFASSISWAAVYTASGGAGSGLYDYIEMYDHTIGDWNGYTSADAIEIGSGQGFWVYGLPGATSLTLKVPESAKTTSASSSIKAPSAGRYFTLKISGDQNAFSHTFRTQITADAQDGLDAADMPFHQSPGNVTPQLYSILEGRKINTNTFSGMEDNYSIVLESKAGYRGHYRINAEGFGNVAEYSCISLEDKLAGKIIDLAGKPDYEFDMDPSDRTDRFVLHFSKTGQCSPEGKPFDNLSNFVEVLPSPAGSLVNFSFSEITPVKIEVLNMLGQSIVPATETAAAFSSREIVLPAEFRGVYIIRITSSKGVTVKELFRN
jgi:hypothetical protein